MNKSKIDPVSKNTQAGVSLISLMIGIALSVITILTATHMHTTHHIAVNDLQESIEHNRAVLTSLKIIEKEVRSAGYGIPGADGNHILIQFDAGDSSTPPVRSLLWRFVEEGVTECRALIESSTTINGSEHRILTLRRSNSCHDYDPIENTNWNDTVGRLGQWQVKGELETHLNTSDTLFSFQLETTDCSFPGHGRPERHLLLTINAPDRAGLNGHGISNGISVCLTNMYPI